MKINMVILCAFILIACQSKEPTLQNETVVKSMFEAFNKHDWKTMASHYSDSAEFLDPSFGHSYVKQTREEIAAKYAEFEKMFPDIKDEVVGIYPSGDVVAVEFVSSGTDSAGNTFTLPIACFLTVKNGKIIKDATYFDLETP